MGTAATAAKNTTATTNPHTMIESSPAACDIAHWLKGIPTLSQAREYLATSAPAALAKAPHQGTSESYKFLDTEPVVEAAYDHGFRLVSASQQPRRRSSASDADSGVHLLRFQRPGETVQVHGTVAQVVFRNGHAANATAKCYAGAFRLACANGLIIPVQGTTVEGFAVRHVGSVDQDAIINGFLVSADHGIQNLERLEQWGAIDTTSHQEEITRHLVGAGIKARWGHWSDVPQSDRRGARDFALTRRNADANDSLYTLMNRVQESLIRGTPERYSRSTRLRVRQIQPCNQLDTQTAINAALWTKTTEIAAYLQG